MPAQILVQAVSHGPWSKGEPVIVRDEADLPTHPWGSREGPPNFVRIRVPDMTAAQIEPQLVPWFPRLTYRVDRNRPQDLRFTISMRTATASRAGTAIKGQLLDFYRDARGATVIDETASSVTLEVAKPFDDDVPRQLVDLFENPIDLRRFRLDVARVDEALANGGTLELTAAQIAVDLTDRDA